MRLSISGRATITLKQGDITREHADAIVNAANSSLLGGGGVDGDIHLVGGRTILEECRRLRATKYPEGLSTGQAVATTAGNLHARYVIHTVGPVWQGGERGEPGLLASCYRESLHVAEDLKLTSIAFPAISTGVYDYPKDKAANIAVRTVVEFLRTANSVTQVRFLVFDSETLAIYQSKFKSLVGPEIQLESTFAP